MKWSTQPSRKGSVGGGSKLNTSERENQRQKKMISTESLYPPLFWKKKKQSLASFLMSAAAYWKARCTKLSHREWQAKDKGERRKEGIDRGRERHQTWQTKWEIEMSWEKWAMYWNEDLWRSAGGSFLWYLRFIVGLSNGIYVCVVARVCVCTLLCLHVRVSLTPKIVCSRPQVFL